jgi:hypothetical protein
MVMPINALPRNPMSPPANALMHAPPGLQQRPYGGPVYASPIPTAVSISREDAQAAFKTRPRVPSRMTDLYANFMILGKAACSTC